MKIYEIPLDLFYTRIEKFVFLNHRILQYSEGYIRLSVISMTLRTPPNGYSMKLSPHGPEAAWVMLDSGTTTLDNVHLSFWIRFFGNLSSFFRLVSVNQSSCKYLKVLLHYALLHC